jgi:hypothetical protein
MQRWRPAWARIDDRSLALFDNDNLAVNDGSSFYRIDLSERTWRVHYQSRPDDERVMNQCELPLLVEIKICEE